MIPERGFQINQSLKDWKEPRTLLEGVEIINGNWSRRRKKKKKKTARGASTTMRKSLSSPDEDRGAIQEDDEEEEEKNDKRCWYRDQTSREAAKNPAEILVTDDSSNQHSRKNERLICLDQKGAEGDLYNHKHNEEEEEEDIKGGQKEEGERFRFGQPIHDSSRRMLCLSWFEILMVVAVPALVASAGSGGRGSATPEAAAHPSPKREPERTNTPARTETPKPTSSCLGDGYRTRVIAEFDDMPYIWPLHWHGLLRLDNDKRVGVVNSHQCSTDHTEGGLLSQPSHPGKNTLPRFGPRAKPEVQGILSKARGNKVVLEADTLMLSMTGQIGKLKIEESASGDWWDEDLRSLKGILGKRRAHKTHKPIDATKRRGKMGGSAKANSIVYGDGRRWGERIQRQYKEGFKGLEQDKDSTRITGKKSRGYRIKGAENSVVRIKNNKREALV
ncbi:hypothetical protein PPACK8108_LOCUS23053 [Phakopsora pachyrhizi]|uniref:Uncharacterized protein n=1 Tax=Phakopsora pachyrhizi TaxID=170000 RepID=A0AAV0BM56_PHAPC|nr:hypothetical protein PPACK8108_LOCUS23053 [Phakopsora pachyrhizi]